MVAIVGSNNVDLVVTVDHFTKPGETQRCLSFERFAGGKGANQAVACKKLGTEVAFLTCVGNDGNGQFAFEKLSQAGVEKFAVKTNLPNGFALIEITKDGENRIIIYPGSNGLLTKDLIHERSQELLKAHMVLLQNEIPFETTFEVARLFKKHGKLVIFDPAPAQNIDKEIFKYVDIITPNESEIFTLTEIKEIDLAVEKLLKAGCRNVLVKMGERGSFFKGEFGQVKTEAFKVKPIDTTAAGDIFNAGFAAEFDRTKDLQKALIFASAAAAISVTRKGAQSSIPTQDEVVEFLKERGQSI
ncbi:ribokinase [Thermotoga profunda]|uniref:ribokinase n=1 Tax=Thermotoga profunda TaxID=1508420 RepID=UPI000596BFED|nr:ribokinase [Thermotoga profunda]